MPLGFLLKKVCYIYDSGCDTYMVITPNQRISCKHTFPTEIFPLTPCYVTTIKFEFLPTSSFGNKYFCIFWQYTLGLWSHRIKKKSKIRWKAIWMLNVSLTILARSHLLLHYFGSKKMYLCYKERNTWLAVGNFTIIS